MTGAARMALDYINSTYGLSVRKGSRVEYYGGNEPTLGTVRGAHGGYLLIKLDGVKHAAPFHPTWKLRVLHDEPAALASESSS